MGMVFAFGYLMNLVALIVVIVFFIKENKIDQKYEKIVSNSDDSENILQEVDKLETERKKLKSKLKIILVCCMIIFGVGVASFFVNTNSCSEEQESHVLTD